MAEPSSQKPWQQAARGWALLMGGRAVVESKLQAPASSSSLCSALSSSSFPSPERLLLGPLRPLPWAPGEAPECCEPLPETSSSSDSQPEDPIQGGLFTGEMNLATSSTTHRLMDNQPETSLALCESNAQSAGQGKAASSVLHTSDLLSPTARLKSLIPQLDLASLEELTM